RARSLRRCEPAPDGVPGARGRGWRWARVLRAEHQRDVRTRGRICRQDPQGCEAVRLTSGTAHALRSRCQHEDGQGARPRNSADPTRPSRRGDRMMRRRAFITLLGSAAAAWRPTAGGKERGVRVVGFLRNTIAPPFAHLVTELGKGLSEEGFVEGRNVIIEQRWGDNQPDRLPGLAADLVRRKASVIVCNTPAVLAAVRVAGPWVPLGFVVGDDPVKMGFVASLNRPEGNLTGVTFFGGSMLGAKRLALLQELVPKISVVAVLLDPNTAFQIELVETAARALGL